MTPPKEGDDGLPKDWITLKIIFQGQKGPKMVKFGYFAAYWQFSQKQSDIFFLHSFLDDLINCQDLIWITRKVIFKVRKVRFGPFSENYYRYYSAVTKCCPTLLHHVASLVWIQTCSKILMVWNHKHGIFQGQKSPMWTFVIYWG